MDIITLSLAKKYANKVAAGFEFGVKITQISLTELLSN